VTVVRLNDDAEFKKMMNNLRPRLKEEGYKARPILVKQGEELRVFVELVLREEAASAPVRNNNHVAEAHQVGT